MMRTPPLASPSSSDSFARTTIFSSSGPSTPTKSWRGNIHGLHHAFDDDSSSEDEGDNGLSGDRLARKRGSKVIAIKSKSQPSPSRFIIKGTVTPSRAAPLFARFSKDRRAAQRSKKKTTDWSESEEENDENFDLNRGSGSSPWTPTKLTPRSRSQIRQPLIDRSPLKSKHQRSSSSCLTSSPSKGSATPPHNVNQSRFIPASFRNAQPPPMPVPIPLSHRAGLVTTNMASYMHAMRSNNLGHLSFATSSRGNTMGSLGRGVLSVAGRLGGGGSGRMCNFSQRAFHSNFATTSNPSYDLFTLPSEQSPHQFSHPICGEYANSSRSLSGQQAQWLAVGNNEGRLFLLNTLEGAMVKDDGSTPSWLAHDGSIFEVKWRPDDEMIATGGSDYQIRVWNTATGEQVRSFSGHRGTPRSIAWDPNGNGNILSSGGRDGAIHLYDLRVPGMPTNEEHDDSSSGSTPIASIWGAHTTEPVRPLKGPGSRGGKRGAQGRATYPKGITSLTYVPGRGANILCSAGCGDGIVKLWDLRTMASYDDINMIDQTSQDSMTINDPLEAGLDISLRFTKNKSSHGISSIVASSTKVFAACTDGCIYTLPLDDLKASSISDLGLPIGPMFDPAQRGNSLYARLALHDDERTLALGCSSGSISVWDTYAATKAASELSSLGVNMANLPLSTTRSSQFVQDTEYDLQNTTEPVSIYGQGQEDLIEMAKPTILKGAHLSTFEINSISWAHGPNGPTLATISDDHTIRTWSASQN